VSVESGATAPIFRWSGEYAGFLLGKWFFDGGGRYLGWCEPDGTVWSGDGRPLGQLVENHYVLRNLTRSNPVRRTPPVAPVPPSPPQPAPPPLPRPPRPGWADGLDQVGRLPSTGNLVGSWGDSQRRLHFTSDGTYRWHEGTDREEGGRWELEGDVLCLHPEAATGDVVYRSVAYAVDTVTLRWHTRAGPGLPITLRRTGSIASTP